MRNVLKVIDIAQDVGHIATCEPRILSAHNIYQCDFPD